MKTLIAILIIASFLQSTILPLDLVLIILICRSFIKEEQENFYLAFSFGLLTDVLNGHLLGIQSIILLAVVLLTQIISRTHFTKNSLALVIPLSLVFLFLNTAIASFLTHQSIQIFPKVVLETILLVPSFYILRIWEERFIVKRDIKLRV